MRAALAQQRLVFLDRWKSGEASWARLPPWMRARVTACDARAYELTHTPPPVLLSLEQFRYIPARRVDRQSGRH
jgi:hypothetical protein